MAVHHKAIGFVFKKEDRLEADRVFSVFTKEFGRLEIFGKGIRKIASKLKGSMELFRLAELEFVQGKHKKTLTDAVSRQHFGNIFSSPEKTEIARGMTELLDGFIKGEQKDEYVLGLVIDTFTKLDTYPARKLIYYYFFWNFISLLGYAPELSKCATCAGPLQPGQLYFSNKEGGIICGNCFTTKKEGVAVEAETVKVLRLIIKKEWNILLKIIMEKSVEKELHQVSENYKHYLLESVSYKKP